MTTLRALRRCSHRTWSGSSAGARRCTGWMRLRTSISASPRVAPRTSTLNARLALARLSVVVPQGVLRRPVVNTLRPHCLTCLPLLASVEASGWHRPSEAAKGVWMKMRLILVLCAGLALTVGVTTASAGGGNSDAAKACQEGGWQNLVREDGTEFKNAGDCVSYAAQGGTLEPSPPVSRATTTSPMTPGSRNRHLLRRHDRHCLRKSGGIQIQGVVGLVALPMAPMCCFPASM